MKSCDRSGNRCSARAGGNIARSFVPPVRSLSGLARMPMARHRDSTPLEA